jgi:hypothetical protein
MAVDQEAPGWAAIDKALERVYPDQKPLHFGTIRPFVLGGPDPLDGISIYSNNGHWHYVGYGCTELYSKDSPEPSVSGFGFEMTFRLSAREKEPPTWPLEILQGIARHVFDAGVRFEEGKFIKCGPLGGHETDLIGLVFAEDPQLGQIDTPHGKMTFLQLVGIRAEELATAQGGDSTVLLQALRRADPMMVTDLARGSVV